MLGEVFIAALVFIVAAVATVLVAGLYVPVYSARHHRHNHPLPI
jgi:hypothetical protein